MQVKRPTFAPVFPAAVDDDGKLVIDSQTRQRMAARAAAFKGRAVDIRLELHKDTRSQRANAYYWSCVLGEMAKYCDHTPEEIHEAMCVKFLPNETAQVEFFNRMTGECLTVDTTEARRSSKLNGAPFYDFVERVRGFALEFLGVETQDPDPEYWRKRHTTEQVA